MKTIFLSVIALVGLLILGTLGYLAFYQADVTQTDFEQEITPASAAPAPAPAPQAAPVLVPVQQTATPAAEAVTSPASAAATDNTVPMPDAE